MKMSFHAAASADLSPHRAGLAQAIVAHVYGVALDDMRCETRGAPRAALARQVAMYLTHIVWGMSGGQIAQAFARHKATAHHALRHIEDLRDDAEFDRTLRFLETMLRDAAGRP